MNLKLGNFIKKLLLITFLVSHSLLAIAGTKDHTFKPGHLAILGPPYANKNYYLIEFGFVTAKKIKPWDYDYNAYVTAALSEDWKDQQGKLRAGALGFRGGVMLPTQPWVPLLFTLTAGYSKTVLHNNPLLGRDVQAAGKKDMLSIDAGLLYHFSNKYFLRFSYQISNVKYFKRHTIITLGVVY